jgi:cytochrome c1
MNITEYWQEKALRAFILNPSSFRRGVKMPTLPYLTEQDAQELVAYLTYMKHHKAEPAANTP